MRAKPILRSAACASTLAFLIYFLTVAPDLTWSNYGIDGGELITAAVKLGVPHPPGYPTYVLLGKLVSYLPFGTMAYRFHLLSALAGAVAAGFVTATAHRLPAPGQGVLCPGGSTPRKQPNRWPRGTTAAAVATGLTFAFAPLVWSQALIAEVYGLNLAFLAAFLWALVCGRPPWLIGLLLGLGVTTHLTSLLMLPLAMALAPRQGWLGLVLGLLAGLTPFLIIPWLAQTGSPVVWGEPTTLPGWWWVVSGQLYRHNLFAVSTAELLSRLRHWTPLLLSQFTWAGLPLLIFGLYQMWRSPWRRGALLMVAGALLYALYALTYNTMDAIVFFLPFLLLASLLLAPALARLGWLSLLLPLTLLLLNFNQQNLSNERAIRPLADELLLAVPPAAIVMTPGDGTIFALWYFQHVEGQRQDIILVDANLFAFDWYRRQIQQRHPDLRGLEQDDLDAFRLQQQGSYCFASITTRDHLIPVAYSCFRNSN